MSENFNPEAVSTVHIANTVPFIKQQHAHHYNTYRYHITMPDIVRDTTFWKISAFNKRVDTPGRTQVVTNMQTQQISRSKTVR